MALDREHPSVMRGDVRRRLAALLHRVQAEAGTRGGGGMSGAILVLAFLATLIASINIFGGFLVTRRMLTMFR